ncbi:MAG: hypothetical protein JRI73_06955 [Deltaproteobacteria bacterium]|nr:hypothetical protein [Deltaproteobacteria bacterium]
MDFELGKSYRQLKIGEEASFTKTITETDVYLFAGISGDFNPMHVNEEFAKKTPYLVPERKPCSGTILDFRLRISD